MEEEKKTGTCVGNCHAKGGRGCRKRSPKRPPEKEKKEEKGVSAYLSKEGREGGRRILFEGKRKG